MSLLTIFIAVFSGMILMPVLQNVIANIISEPISVMFRKKFGVIWAKRPTKRIEKEFGAFWVFYRKRKASALRGELLVLSTYRNDRDRLYRLSLRVIIELLSLFMRGFVNVLLVVIFVVVIVFGPNRDGISTLLDVAGESGQFWMWFIVGISFSVVLSPIYYGMGVAAAAIKLLDELGNYDKLKADKERRLAEIDVAYSKLDDETT